jgi:hypothetical protein
VARKRFWNAHVRLLMCGMTRHVVSCRGMLAIPDVPYLQHAPPPPPPPSQHMKAVRDSVRGRAGDEAAESTGACNTMLFKKHCGRK